MRADPRRGEPLVHIVPLWSKQETGSKVINVSKAYLTGGDTTCYISVCCQLEVRQGNLVQQGWRIAGPEHCVSFSNLLRHPISSAVYRLFLNIF